MPITLSKIQYEPRSIAHFEALEQTCRLHQLSGSGEKYFFLLARSIKATVDHKNFSFFEQTLHKGLIDASCDWLQSTRKNRGQNKFLRKLRAKIQFLRLLFSSLRSISSYNPHTILKNARRGRLKKYIYFYLQKLQVGPGDAACRELQYATKNMARTNFLRKI